MTQDWQSITALGIVLVTALIFGVRAWKRSRRKAGCGGGCGCDFKTKRQPKK